MTLVDVLMTVRRAGLSIRPNGDMLRVSPVHKLTPELTDLLRDHKAELLALLRRRDRVDELQQICDGCGDLFVDFCGYGRCLACVTPANRAVA